MTFFGCNVLRCLSMNNQECKIRPKIININSNEPSFYRYSIEVNKCSSSCNNINDPYAKLCLPDVVEEINVKVFNLMSRANETRHKEWHETCKCKCRLDGSVCNNKQSWNNDKCKCECKELVDKGKCDKGFIWNPSIFECESDKLCDTGKYFDYCKLRKDLVSKLVEECSENIDGNEMIYDGTVNDYGKVCNSCTIYKVLFVIDLLITIGISSAYFYFHWYLKKDNTTINASVNTERVIY